MKKYAVYIVSLLLLISCVEEIDLQSFSSESLLVVEAKLTNELKQHTVKLTRTSPLNSDETQEERNAIVRIIDTQQNIYSFAEGADGVYTSTVSFKASIDTAYHLEIKTADGELYITSPQQITAVNALDEITIEKATNTYDEAGIKIMVTSEDPQTDANYYYYTFEETYIVKAPYWSNYKLQIGNSPRNIAKIVNPDAEAARVCYKTENSIELLQTETSSLSTNSVYNFPIHFIKKTNSKIWHRYSILVKQHIQSYDAYSYYKTLKKLATTENSFSQVQQGFLIGNILPTKNQEKKAIGYFEVTSVSQKRIFFNFIDIFPNHGLSFTDGCEIEAPKIVEALHGSVDYPLYEALTIRKLRFARVNEIKSDQLPGPFKITSKECVDCRYTASNIKPDFWID